MSGEKKTDEKEKVKKKKGKKKKRKKVSARSLLYFIRPRKADNAKIPTNKPPLVRVRVRVRVLIRVRVSENGEEVLPGDVCERSLRWR